jgi:riboflavin-specific deaminase-like protein
LNAKRKTPDSKLPSKRPFVLVNMSMTADGKIASANRVVSSFSSRRDQQHLLELRATADAVMCGARTVDLNNINLGPGGPAFRKLRLKRGLAEFNLRIIVTGRGTLNPNAAIFAGRKPASARAGLARSPILIFTTAAAGPARLKRLRALADDVQVFGTSELDLRAALRWLRAEHGVKRLLSEGGGELNDALFRAGLVDELHLTLCPRIVGGRHAPTIADGLGFPSLSRAAHLRLESARHLGDELFLVYSSCKSHA